MNSITRLDTPSHNEVDLIAIGRSIWTHRRTVFVAGIVCMGLAALYSFGSTKQYETTSVLRPVALNELDALNRSGVYKLSPKDALANVAASLDSYETRLNFYRDRPQLFEIFRKPGLSDDQAFDFFNRDSLKLILPGGKDAAANTYISLRLTYPEGMDGARLLNELVTYAIEAERRQVVTDVAAVVKNRIVVLEGNLRTSRDAYETEKQSRVARLLEADSLRRINLLDELKGLRLQLRAQRNARIAQLDEAISIARNLGIAKPTTPSAMGAGELVAQGSVIRTEVNNQQVPLYFMGTEALVAEREALRNRSSDDFTAQRVAEIAKELEMLKVNREVEMLQSRKDEELFLKGVEEYRAELNRLHNLELDMGQLKLVSVDRQAMEPLAPVKPRKALITLIGLLVGVISGITIAIIRYMIASHRPSVQRLDVVRPANSPHGGSEAA